MILNNTKNKNKLTALALALCLTGTSITNFTREVYASEVNSKNINTKELTLTKLRDFLRIKNSKSVDLTSDDIVNYDFSNYKIVDSNAEKHTRTIVAVDTIITLIIYNDDPKIDVEKVFDETEALVNEYEDLISKTRNDSFTKILNTTGEYDYGNSDYKGVITQLVDKSRFYEELSAGAFDVTIEPIVKLWNINNGNTEIPEQNKIDTALVSVNYKNFVDDKANQKYKLTNNAEVDFGGIAKGQLADLIKASLMSKGINSALVNLGGNVVTIGAKPGDADWVIGVQSPDGEFGEIIGTLAVKNKSVVSSGNYERYFVKDGVRYHHIMNTKTGYPSTSGLVQTTIISDRSIDCDALSTTTFLLGKDKSLKLIESLEGFECMLIDEDMNYYYSENFAKDYKLEISK